MVQVFLKHATNFHRMHVFFFFTMFKQFVNWNYMCKHTMYPSMYSLNSEFIKRKVQRTLYERSYFEIFSSNYREVDIKIDIHPNMIVIIFLIINHKFRRV